jgi:hypothetical protein
MINKFSDSYSQLAQRFKGKAGLDHAKSLALTVGYAQALRWAFKISLLHRVYRWPRKQDSVDGRFSVEGSTKPITGPDPYADRFKLGEGIPVRPYTGPLSTESLGVITPPTLRGAIKLFLAKDLYSAVTSDPFIALDFVPSDIEYRVEPNTRDLKVIGRNTGVYHHGGAEDSMSFDIHWYGDDANELEAEKKVIEKCRKIEALGKAGGWGSAPPIIYIQWGDSPKNMFRNHLFVLEKTEYTLKNFISTRKVMVKGVPQAFPYHLNPVHAVQRVTFKRVSLKQLSYSQIMYGNL